MGIANDRSGDRNALDHGIATKETLRDDLSDVHRAGDRPPLALTVTDPDSVSSISAAIA